MSAPHPRYEVVIGLEVHNQLATESKLFSGAPVRYGDPPNHAVTPVCLALPGALPVLNQRAVELAIRAGLATGCRVHPQSIFARKNYFYPDLPKGYQISQYEEPICTGGHLEIELPEEAGGGTKRVGITRIHLEEDAGKSLHGAGGSGSLVDLNRAGVPLIEIVSEPDLRSPAEAGAYLRTLRSVLRYIEVSEADMEKGQFRCDANISLRLHGASELGTRTELKNLNSFRFVERALEAEIQRQAELLDDGGAVEQATYLFDPDTGETRVMRSKEDADDYRYFPDPDLIPLVFDEARIEEVKRSLPELPAARRARFQQQFDLSEYDAAQLTASRELAGFFEAAVAAHGTAKTVANWMQRDLREALRAAELDIESAALTPAAFAALLGAVDAGRVTPKNAQTLLAELVARGGDPEALIEERGLASVTEGSVLDSAIAAVLAAHPEQVERFRGGEEKMLHFLMGQVMKRTQGKADPKAVRQRLATQLGS